MDNLWQRRSNSSKLSLSAKDSNNTSQEHYRPESARPCQVPKRLVSEVSPSAKSSSVNGVTPLATSNLVSPSPGASSAFGLGSGAFASFGSTARIPRTPSTSLHIGDAAPHIERRGQEVTTELSSEDVVRRSDVPYLHSRASAICPEHTLKATWVIWYRPPTHKFSDYEKSTMPLAIFGSVEAFWKVYTHLKRPSALPSVSDYHIFKKGVRPVWEDQENKRGGKWILRLRKGVADRYWEDLLLAIVGDQFAEAGEEICGAVLSVRTGEDVLSIWTRIDGGKNIKIRETVKRLLALPPDTTTVWKSHDDSIAQRSAIDEARKDQKGHQGQSKKRETSVEVLASDMRSSTVAQ